MDLINCINKRVGSIHNEIGELRRKIGGIAKLRKSRKVRVTLGRIGDLIKEKENWLSFKVREFFLKFWGIKWDMQNLIF